MNGEPVTHSTRGLRLSGRKKLLNHLCCSSSSFSSSSSSKIKTTCACNRSSHCSNKAEHSKAKHLVVWVFLTLLGILEGIKRQIGTAAVATLSRVQRAAVPFKFKNRNTQTQTQGALTVCCCSYGTFIRCCHHDLTWEQVKSINFSLSRSLSFSFSLVLVLWITVGSHCWPLGSWKSHAIVCL